MMGIAPDPAVHLDLLLAHREWVRTLALALTRDENEADDVEQQTWLAAMTSPPSTGESPRGWLTTVARNAARKQGRSRRRRRAREKAVARGEASSVSDPADLAARADAHAQVATAVVALPEPYRQALLLRYLEGLAVAEVATQMGAPLETTRARLRRGREQLRGRLERDVGRGRPLAVVLLPLLDRDTVNAAVGGAATVAVGGLAMAWKLAGGIVLGLALLGGAWWGLSGGENALNRADADAHSVDPEIAAAPEVESVASVARSPRSNRVRVRPPPADERLDVAEMSKEDTRTVAELLQERIDVLRFASDTARTVFAEISDITGIAIHADVRSAASLDSMPMTMQFSDVTAVVALKTLVRVCGLRLAVEADRVVLHSGSDEWSAGMATEVIEPASRDPNAPQSLVVRGTVVDPSGIGVPGASIYHSGLVATTDEHGAFSAELKKQFGSLFARKGGLQRSNIFRVSGRYGDEVEVALVMGGPAGTAVIRVTSSSGEVVKSARVRFRWMVPPSIDTASVPEIPEPTVAGASASSRDGEPATIDYLPEGEIELTVSARGHVREARVIEIIAGSVSEMDVELRKADVADRLRDERISFDVTDEPLNRLLARIRRESALQVTFASGTPGDVFGVTVSLRVADDTIEGALRAICLASGHSLKWKVRGDTVILFEE